MKTIKKILHIIFSLFLIWQTIMLVERLLCNPQTDFSDRFLDAIFLNVFVTGIFTIVYSFPVYKLLPERYYLIKNPGQLKLLGKIIQIEIFKRLLIKTLWNKKQNKRYFFNGSRNGFDSLKIATMKSEFGHFIGFCIVLTLSILIGIVTSFTMAIMILVVNIFFNFYPFMLQRFHRLRLDGLKQRFSK